LSSQRRAEIILLSVTIVWGSTFVVTKVILAESSPLFYSGLRFLLSTLILFLVAHKTCLKTTRSAIKHGSVLGFLLYLGFVLQTIGIKYTTASKAAFFTGMLVPLTPVVQFIAQHWFNVRKRPLKIGNILGVICAAGGLYLLTSPEGSAFNIGDALNLICALFFAIFIVYLDTIPADTDKLQLTFVQFLFCGVVGVIVALPFEEIRVSTSSEFIIALLYLTIFATVITMWAQNRFQGDTTPTRAAVIFAMEPVVAAIFGFYVRGEIIGLLGIIGGVVIVSGLILSEFSDEIPLLKVNLTSTNG
jgi:drug/metabolite transporter (DMT)-like permease